MALLSVALAVPTASATELSTEELNALVPLAPLPQLPDTAKEIAPEARAQVQSLLAALVSSHEDDRNFAASSLQALDSSAVLALREQLTAIADAHRAEDLKKDLLAIRERAREQLRKKQQASGQTGSIETPDYLVMLLNEPKPDNSRWMALTQIIAISRASSAIASTDAALNVIEVYVRFGEFLRVDTQLQLKKLDDYGIAALIETTLHQSNRIANWAKKILDQEGKTLPSKAVQGQDPAALAAILIAYGKTKNADALQMVLSFTNSERSLLRDSARTSIALYGSSANWELRESFERLIGNHPSKEWAWDRVARELFRALDSQRLNVAFEQLRAANTAIEQGKPLEACQHFSVLIAHDPSFPAGDKMADQLLECALSKEDLSIQNRILYAARAERLAIPKESKLKATATRLALEARRSYTDDGSVDRVRIERALSLDPSNRFALELKEETHRSSSDSSGSKGRPWLQPLLISLTAALGFFLLLFRRKSPAIPNSSP